MAIAKGNKSEEVQDFKRYIGVSSMFIKAINPNKAEYEKVFNTTLDEAPSYIKQVEDNDGNSFTRAKVQIVFQMANDKYPSDVELLKDFNNPDGTKISMTLSLDNRPKTGATSGKTQVIDKYGRTAWVTPEELASHSIPVYSNGPADIDKNYRPAYVGEEELVKFIKVFLEIPDVTVWNNDLGKRVPNPDVKPEECECMLESFDKIFKGDFSEITDAIGLMPTNRIKVLLGVRTDFNTGRLYQAVYNKTFLKNKVRNYNTLDKEIQNSIEYAAKNNKVLDTEYRVIPVEEYSVEPTTFTPSTDGVPTSDMPFEADVDSSSPWN